MGFSNQISEEGMIHTIIWFIQPPHTIFKNIKCLLPGYILKVNINGKILENKSFCSDFNNTQVRDNF